VCGIIGYVGSRESKPLLLHGLERLEYRGYDSAGLALLEDDGLAYVRAVGNLQNLKSRAGTNSAATTGLGHTRWATHGAVTEENAHPLAGCDEGRISVVLNGIVENFRELKQGLRDEGHVFTSETDAETVVHLVERHYEGDLVEAVRRAFNELEGHFAFVVIHRDHPGLLVGARLQCPLVVGVGDGEMFLASSIAAFQRETNRVQLIEDGEVVAISARGALFLSTEGERRARDEIVVDWDDESAERHGFETYMLKEIYEQPTVIGETLRTLFDPATRAVTLPDLPIDLAKVSRFIISACGTAYYAGLTGKYWFERLARIPCEVDIASEFRYRQAPLPADAAMIVISQSGETIDTLEAARHARRQGSSLLAVTNTVGSSLAREADGVIYMHAGPEIGVAATKTFATQMVSQYILAMYLAQVRGSMFPEEIAEGLTRMAELPAQVGAAIRLDEPPVPYWTGGSAVMAPVTREMSAHQDRTTTRRRSYSSVR
jgi:glutamine---fructose-6-phosphate transaminase (isomerizing)